MHFGATVDSLRTEGLSRGSSTAGPLDVPTGSQPPLVDCLRPRRSRLRNDSRVRERIGGRYPGLDDGPDSRPTADHECAADATSSGPAAGQSATGYTASPTTSRAVASAAVPAAPVKPTSRSVRSSSVRSRPPAETCAPLGGLAPCQAPRSVVSTLRGSFTASPERSRPWSCRFDARSLFALERPDRGDRGDRVRPLADCSRGWVRARLGVTGICAGPPR